MIFLFNTWKRWLAGCLLILLAACGGSSSSGTIGPAVQSINFDDFQQTLSADETYIQNIVGDPATGDNGIAGTVWASVPSTGSAVFRGAGVGRVGADTSADEITLRGEVYLTVQFGADEINGGMNRITAATNGNAYDVDGTVTFRNGDIGVGRPTEFTVDYAGDLDVGGSEVALDGSMDGMLRGTRINVSRRSPVKAVSAIDADGTATVDGVAQSFDFQIAAENN